MGLQRLLSWVQGLRQNGRAVQARGVLGASAAVSRSAALVELLGAGWTTAEAPRPQDAYVRFALGSRVFVEVYLIDIRGPEACVRVIRESDPPRGLGGALVHYLVECLTYTVGSDIERVLAALKALLDTTTTAYNSARVVHDNVMAATVDQKRQGDADG